MHLGAKCAFLSPARSKGAAARPSSPVAAHQLPATQSCLASGPRCVSWVVYGVSHTITFRTSTPNEVAEATCSSGQLRSHRGCVITDCRATTREIGRPPPLLPFIFPRFDCGFGYKHQRTQRSGFNNVRHVIFYHLMPPWFFPEPSTKVASC